MSHLSDYNYWQNLSYYVDSLKSYGNTVICLEPNTCGELFQNAKNRNPRHFILEHNCQRYVQWNPDVLGDSSLSWN